ncbi:MAG TPA: hypothetical protein VGC87_12180 [Pyrinomonadaceae bacterium]
MNELLTVEGLGKHFRKRRVLEDVCFSVFNGKERNVVLWTFNQGKRSFVKKGSEDVPLAMNQWHSLQISVHGTNLQAALNGKHLLDYTLAEPVSGKVGLWSKTDSVSYFDDFTVAAAAR